MPGRSGEQRMEVESHSEGRCTRHAVMKVVSVSLTHYQRVGRQLKTTPAPAHALSQEGAEGSRAMSHISSRSAKLFAGACEKLVQSVASVDLHVLCHATDLFSDGRRKGARALMHMLPPFKLS